MRSLATKRLASLASGKRIGAFVAIMLVVGVGGCATLALSATNAPAPRTIDMAAERLSHSLIGSYVVTGTDPDGRPYVHDRIVDAALAPSGALELEWDNGKEKGVGQLVGDVLVVAKSTNAGTAIMLMTINPDGSVSGQWWRRLDRGHKGTEEWKKM